MKIIYKNQTKIFKNNEACTAIEYPSDEKAINGAVIELAGRYPAKGRAMNLECKEMAYVIKGLGKVVVEGEEIKLNEGDLVLIDKMEKYFFEGKLIMLGSCAPAWYPEQHREVE